MILAGVIEQGRVVLRIFILIIIIVLNFVLQTTLGAHISIVNVTPNTALALIVSYAILRGDIEGALFGFFAGLLQDVSGGMIIGLFALIGFVVGYFCGKPFKEFEKANYLLPFAVVVVSSLFSHFVVFVVTVMFTGQLAISNYLQTIVLPGTIYTAVVSIPIYIIFHFINKKLEKREDRFRSIIGDKRL